MIAMTFVLSVFGLAAVGLFWNGLALMILWGWFMVPTFGLPILTLAPAIGLALVFNHLAAHDMPLPTDDNDRLAQLQHAFVQMMIRPAIALVAGWVVKQWM